MKQFNPKESVDQLWKREKKEFRVWVIAALVCYLLLAVANLIVFPLMIINRTTIIENQAILLSKIKGTAVHTAGANLGDSKSPIDITDLISQTVLYGLITDGLRALLLVTLASLFTYSVIISYKRKDLANLSSFAIISYQIFAFIYLIHFIIWVLFGRGNNVDNYIGGLTLYAWNMPLSLKFAKGILFSMAPLVVITSFLFFRRVRNIKTIFLISRKVSEVSDMLRESINQDTLKNNFNPWVDLGFGRKPTDATKEKTSTGDVREVEVGNKSGEEIDNKYSYLDQAFIKSDTFKKIVSLSREQLDKIAKKLSIFAYRKLAKDELLKRILLIYEDEWAKKKK